MSITISRRLIFTILSTPGMIHLKPADFTPEKRPSRNTTPRSYSVMMRTPATNPNTKIPIKIATNMVHPLQDSSAYCMIGDSRAARHAFFERRLGRD